MNKLKYCFFLLLLINIIYFLWSLRSSMMMPNKADVVSDFGKKQIFLASELKQAKPRAKRKVPVGSIKPPSRPTPNTFSKEPLLSEPLPGAVRNKVVPGDDKKITEVKIDPQVLLVEPIKQPVAESGVVRK